MMDNTRRVAVYGPQPRRTAAQNRRLRKKEPREVRQRDAARRESTAVMRAAMAPPVVGIDPGDPVGVYLNRDPAGDALSAEVLAAALRPAAPLSRESRMIGDAPIVIQPAIDRFLDGARFASFEDVT